LSVAVIAARLADFAGDDAVTQLLPTPNVVRSRPQRFVWLPVDPDPSPDAPTVEFEAVRPAHAGLLSA
jgi:hypothetical protein